MEYKKSRALKKTILMVMRKRDGETITSKPTNGTHWIRHWSLLQKEEDQPPIKWGCRMIETVTMQIFITNE
jgi:hypothetical protein